MKFIIATTASLLLLCTGAAMAQQSMYEGQQDHLDTNDSGAVNRQEYQAFMTKAFEKLDADNDGALNQAETADVLNVDQFAATDANGNGRVSRDEFVVFASYYGDPKRSAEKHANEIGQISLEQQDEQVAIPGTGGHARISGARVDTKRLEWLAGPVKVNVNVASARKSGSDNLLNCDFIDGPLSDVRREPVTLHCGLIEEDVDTKLRP